MLISSSVRDGIISHDEFLEIKKKIKKNIMVSKMKTKLTFDV